ncbi:hypothetical protein TKK_0014753 [Trichogramma kaykai]|uniref:Mab-21-like nucleotidyltransferase domain-containing protein n=1 Tax=Trichogramma kaykai TaxID=54128 RepID=A0ABD2WCS3_9HYME
MVDENLYRIKKYSDDTAFSCISKYFITLKDEEIKANNQHLHNVVSQGLIPLMKEDTLFKDIYRNIKYEGSYFKGTKVVKPDEYDLNLSMKLPLNYNELQVETNHKHFSYVKIKVNSESKLPKWEEHSKILNKWLSDKNYLNQNKFHQWMEAIMTNTYKKLKKSDNFYELEVDGKNYRIKQFKKSGPAFTIFVELGDHPTLMSMDIVPCLELNDIILQGYKTFPDVSPSKCVVAKPSKEPEGEFLWRLSFYDQEKQILLNSEVSKLKVVVKMIKKLRDQLNYKRLASYYIETIFLHEIAKRKSDVDFFRASKTSLFIYMLQKLIQALEKKCIPYFWHEGHNLIGHLQPKEIENYANRLKNILLSIDKKIVDDRFAMAEFLLNEEEKKILLEIVESSKTNGSDTQNLEKSEVIKKIKHVINDGKNKENQNSSATIVTHAIYDRTENDLERRIAFLCEELKNLGQMKEQIPLADLNKLSESFKIMFS